MYSRNYWPPIDREGEEEEEEEYWYKRSLSNKHKCRGVLKRARSRQRLGGRDGVVALAVVVASRAHLFAHGTVVFLIY